MVMTSREPIVAELLLPDIRQLLGERRFGDLRSALAELADPEAGDLLSWLEPGERSVVYRLLPRDRRPNIFTYLDQEEREQLLEALSERHVAQVLDDMEPDDRVGFLEDIEDDEVVAELLGLMNPDERRETERILEWPEESIGRLTTPDFLTVRPEWTCAEALAHIRAHGTEAETVSTLYLVDDARRLLDVVRLRHIVLAPPETRVDALREGTVMSLNATDDREEAVRMMERYDVPVLPVVDEENHLLGIVTFDDVADVASEETTEDIHKLGGMSAMGGSYFSTRITRLVRKRVGWLAALFCAGLLTITAMGVFERQLAAMPILALFVPLIIASGGNTGTQAATLMIRALALGEVSRADWWRILGRELLSGLMLGGVLGVLGMIVATGVGLFMLGQSDATGALAHAGFPQALHVGFAIGTAVVGVVVVGNLVGSMLPMLLERIGVDPATSSTPFVATVVDVAGLLVYFAVALTILGV